jgi:glycosyltransferase involved in cell wall biosynthesis
MEMDGQGRTYTARRDHAMGKRAAKESAVAVPSPAYVWGMVLSIVIPAFNEEKELPGCLASVREAVASCGMGAGEVEVVVCDNNSTDQTAELARQGGARVVFEPVNQISRARNAGAAAASGEWLLFIDADSRLAVANVRRVAALARDGAPVAGGGCVIRLEGIPWWTRPGLWGWNLYSVTRRVAAGSFVFCRADAHREVGGFSLERYAAEELEYSRQLRRWGRERGMRFVVLRGHPHVSSGRKFRQRPPSELIRLLLRLALSYRHVIRDRRALDYFYDGRR